MNNQTILIKKTSVFSANTMVVNVQKSLRYYNPRENLIFEQYTGPLRNKFHPLITTHPHVSGDFPSLNEAAGVEL